MVKEQIFKTKLAQENWETKYRYSNESPLGTQVRAAKALASVEAPGQQEYYFEKFLNVLVKFEPLNEGETPQDYAWNNEDVEIIKKFGKPVGLKNTLGGRITANIGTAFHGATLMNCFINGPVSDAVISYKREIPNTGKTIDVEIKTEETPDNLKNIILTILEQAETLKSEGGWGIDFSWIRPRGSLIKGIGIEHPGVVKYMEVFDKVSEVIVQGNNDGYKDTLKNYAEAVNLLNSEEVEAVKKMARKGAMMGVLRCDHPDIEEFVRAKQVPGRLTKFNISVMMTDEFLHAVENNKLFDLKFNGKVYKTVEAKKLYDLIMLSTYNRAEPGVLFYDNIQKTNPLSYVGENNATNPCGEIPGNPYTSTVCLLGNINLTQYVKKDRTFDWESLERDIPIFARMLDNVNDLTYAPLPQYDWAIKNVRQYGMGINGLGSTMFMLGIKFNSKEGKEFTRKVTQLKEELTWKTSALLAQQKGPAPIYNEKFLETEWFTKHAKISEETKELIRKYGVRNGKTTTNAPNGNTSVITDNTSNGIEPVFSLQYNRTYTTHEWPEGLTVDNVKSVLKEKVVGDATVWEGEYAGKIYYYEPHNRGLCIIETVRDYGYGWLLENYPQELAEGNPDYLVTTENLSVDDHLEIQAVIQENINQAVSKTINIPNSYPFEDFGKLYLNGWKKGLVGLTTYRAGTMEAVLSSVTEEKETKSEVERVVKLDIKLPDEFINGNTKVIKREGKKFYINFSYLPDDANKEFPVAMWIQTNSDGEIRQANAAVKKLVELLKKYDISDALIEKQLEKIKGNQAHTRVAKMVSMCLRHNLPLHSIVNALNSIEELYVTDLVFAVKKFLSEHIEDGIKVHGYTCNVCGSTNIIFESGCNKCLDCGASNYS